MVRLNKDGGATLAGGLPNDAQPHVVDEVAGRVGLASSSKQKYIQAQQAHKRSRPIRNSLDYKPDEQLTDQTLPKLPEQPPMMSQQQQRRSAGIGGDQMPPGMDNAASEELYRRMAEAMKRGAAGSKIKGRYDDRLDHLKKQGFPFAQWAFVLIVLGFMLYRLYRLLKPPTKGGTGASASSSKKQHQKASTGGGGRSRGGSIKAKGGKAKVGGSGTGKRAQSLSDSPAAAAAATPATKGATDDTLNKVVADIEGASPEGGGTSPGSITANSKKTVKKKQRKPKAKSSTQVKKEDAPTTTGDKGGSSGEAQISSAEPVASNDSSAAQEVMKEDEGDDAWQTVGNAITGKGKNGVANKKADVGESSKSEKENDSVPGAQNKPTNGSSAEVPEAASKKKSKKKKKNSKNGSEATNDVPKAAAGGKPVAGSESVPAEPLASSSTDSDEALAQRLQEEENKLGNGKAKQQEDDEWAEVSTRKKKTKA